MKIEPRSSIAVCSFALVLGQSAIQLFPAGEFDAPNGALKGVGPWRIDANSAAALIQRARRRANDILVDYEHQSLLSADNGQPAPAAGWMRTAALRWTEQGLFADAPAWTARAAEMIANGEYRYLSPVFSYDLKTRAPLDIISAALTNTPAIDGMQAVSLAAAKALSINSMGDSALDDLFERLCYLLNLPLTTSPEEMSGQLDKLKTMVAVEATEDSAAASLFGILQRRDEKIAALSASRPDPAQFAPVAAMSAMQAELAALKAAQLKRDIEDLIVPAQRDGRLMPTQIVWAQELGASNLAALKTYLETAQPIAALKGRQSLKATGLDDTHYGAPSLTGRDIAALASKYQAEQAALGMEVDDIAAVLHINKTIGVAS